MHHTTVSPWQHSHVFNAEKRATETKTLVVVVITLVTMIAEIAAGWLCRSMALYADGWHMGTHAVALGISLAAYILARKLANDRAFAFGTWKIEILGAYSSSLLLGIVGLTLIGTSIERFVNPVAIAYDAALIVAVVGLAVNGICAVILQESHSHTHHNHDHHHHTDLNHRAAFMHVLADAATSVLAIIALVCAKCLGWNWCDPAMGIVGAILIVRWALILIRQSAGILLDREQDSPLIRAIHGLVEQDNDSKVTDIHLWRVSQNAYACIVSIVAREPHTIDDYRSRLAGLTAIEHLTIEINRCTK